MGASGTAEGGGKRVMAMFEGITSSTRWHMGTASPPHHAVRKQLRNGCNCQNMISDDYINIVIDTMYACTHTRANESSWYVSAVLEAVHSAIVVLTDEEPRDDTISCSPLSPSGLNGPLSAISLPVEAEAPHPLISPPRGEGHPPVHLNTPILGSNWLGFQA